MERTEHALPDADTARAVVAKMMLIRRFEERAGEMYAKAKIGGFLHLCIGEEATIVGATQALREGDYLLSTYREHGQALAIGTDPKAVMAELFGKASGTSGGRGGSGTRSAARAPGMWSCNGERGLGPSSEAAPDRDGRRGSPRPRAARVAGDGDRGRHPRPRTR